MTDCSSTFYIHKICFNEFRFCWDTNKKLCIAQAKLQFIFQKYNTKKRLSYFCFSRRFVKKKEEQVSIGWIQQFTSLEFKTRFQNSFSFVHFIFVRLNCSSAKTKINSSLGNNNFCYWRDQRPSTFNIYKYSNRSSTKECTLLIEIGSDCVFI